MSNKDRVFIAVYTRPGSSELASLSSTKSKPPPSAYQWGLWVEPKNSTGHGTSFDLEDQISFSSVTNPFGWRFHIDDHKTPPPRMLGRLMIGKMPEGMSGTDLSCVLKDVPLPSDPGSHVVDSVGWILAVIEVLQEVGAAETFPIDNFLGDALAYAHKWHTKGRTVCEKVNYTWSRTFP
jgi:hypothetical protein